MKILVLLGLLVSLEATGNLIDQYTDPIHTISTIGDKAKARPVTHTEVGTKRGVNVVNVGGFVSTANSSAVPLGISSIFAGTAEDISNYSTVTVFVDSDVDGTLRMRFSADGVNWDRIKSVSVDQEIGSGHVHTLETVAQYFSVSYENQETAQGHFRLQTIYHTDRSGFLTSSPDERISKLNDAQIIRNANDPILDIGRGLYSDKFSFHRFGFCGTVPNGSFTDLWGYCASDTTYNWPLNSEGFRVRAGGHENDTAGGTGARSIQIQYLDSTGVQRQEQIALAGTSASASTSVPGRRLIRAWVDTGGTYGETNLGTIIIENDVTNEIVGVITASIGQTQLSQYTVPKDYTCYLRRIHVDVATGTNKEADVRVWQRQLAYTSVSPVSPPRIVRQWTAVQNDNEVTYEHSPEFPALTDVWVEAQGVGAATSADIDYDLICVKDEAPKTPQ